MTGLLVRVTVVVAVLGVGGYDVVSVVAGRVHAAGDAQTAAVAASADWQTDHDVQQAYAAAVRSVSDAGERVLTTGFSIDPDNTVHLELRRTIPTLVIGHIGPLRHYTITLQHGDADAVGQ